MPTCDLFVNFYKKRKKNSSNMNISTLKWINLWYGMKMKMGKDGKGI